MEADDAANSVARDGAIIFGDLIGQLDALEVACDKCGRKGRCTVARLIEQRGLKWISPHGDFHFYLFVHRPVP